MTMIGLSIATDRNLDMVTPNADDHDRILSTKREDIFATIIGASSQGGRLLHKPVRISLNWSS